MCVSQDEILARYIFFSRYIRRDETVRLDAYVPHPREDLSVTRHTGYTQEKIWQIGHDIAKVLSRPLHGRSDVKCKDVLDQGLAVNADPTEDNPNHANITGWPKDKSAQKLIAAVIAKAAGKVIRTP